VFSGDVLVAWLFGALLRLKPKQLRLLQRTELYQMMAWLWSVNRRTKALVEEQLVRVSYWWYYQKRSQELPEAQRCHFPLV
jgi:hypothetical protein